MEQKELKIDPELRDLLPPLTDDEYKRLEKNIVENGFDKNFPIMEWHGYIVDGHNRYSVCQKKQIVIHIRIKHLQNTQRFLYLNITIKFQKQND